jgi:hypothetical protein
MKLPFDFGVKLFFRLLIPGFFLSLGFFPFMSKLLFWTGWKIAPEYFFLGSTALLGWLLIILDMPIYMLFEGRRFWPGPIRKLFLNF